MAETTGALAGGPRPERQARLTDQLTRLGFDAADAERAAREGTPEQLSMLTELAEIAAGRAEPASVQDQLERMRAAARAVLSVSRQRQTYWSVRWQVNVLRANKNLRRTRKQFYALQVVAVCASVIVPSLIGLNLSDTGGVVVRWVTFALGLVAALSTAMLALFHFRDRWFLYRNLQEELLAAGWVLINRPGPTAADWTAFVKATESAITRYNAAYDSEVIPATSPQGGGNAADASPDGAPVRGD